MKTRQEVIFPISEVRSILLREAAQRLGIPTGEDVRCGLRAEGDARDGERQCLVLMVEREIKS